ncbi:MAG: tRNA pseudouridine(13) synthase TruD [Planctomycetes bacterium]|nr:tRNA pseudouridine(13) synthase TruD [Planctomycetota bacterium]
MPGAYSLGVDTFTVDELPAYVPSGSGEHGYARIEKRGLSTMHLVDRMAAELGCPAREIGYAGLKDRHATTRQWFSFPSTVDLDAIERLAIEGVDVLEVGRHGNKLKLGHLRGNRFTVDVVCDVDLIDDARTNLEDLAVRGVPNYFGPQRFGSGGRNLEKGLRILLGNPARARRRMRKPLLRLLLSSVQSEAFNRVLAARVDDCDEVRAGDVAYLHANGACFLVEDALRERVRCSRFEISPSGPLPGPKCLEAAGAQRDLEASVLAELGIEPAAFRPFASNPGERRPLRARLTEPLAEPVAGGVRLGFTLNRGSFATTVLAELFDDPPWVEDDEED